jgi:hypothetical protein
MRALGRCSEERQAFLLGEIFAIAIAMKEISGHHFPLLSLGHALPAWGIGRLAGLTSAQDGPVHGSPGDMAPWMRGDPGWST